MKETNKAYCKNFKEDIDLALKLKNLADYGGNGIYLGGEDVLAFLPLHVSTKI
jgi:hypothetical protein